MTIDHVDASDAVAYLNREGYADVLAAMADPANQTKAGRPLKNRMQAALKMSEDELNFVLAEIKSVVLDA